MKKTLLIISSLAFACSVCAAQDDDVRKAAQEAAAAMLSAPEQTEAAAKPVYWTKSIDFDLGFNQTGLVSWAAGGYNTLSLSAGVDAKANYAKGLMSWNNRLQLNYGILYSADKEGAIQKSNDRIYFESKWAYKTGKESKWNYTASFDFRSQFSDTPAKYVQESENKWVPEGLKSSLLSPGYTNIAFGMEWRPNDWFNLNVAPLTGGFTICTVEDLRKSYGMKLKDDSFDPDLGSSYKSTLFQFGAQIKADLNITINEKFNYNTQLVIFTDYLDQPFKHNRVNWDNKFTWNAAKFFKVGFNTWMIYDPLVEFDGVTSKVQFKEFFTISFTYTLTDKK